MSEKMYAQFDEEGICVSIGTPNITSIEATVENLGMKYEDGVWIAVETPVLPPEPTVADLMVELEAMKVGMKVTGVLPKDFVQPTGAHDAYRLGTKVVYQGQIWECIMDYNAFSPTDYPAGWKLV